MKTSVRSGVMIGLAWAGVVFAPAPGQATHEGFGVYEDWSAANVRGDRWRGGEAANGQEVVRKVAGAPDARQLTMRLRREGDTDSDTGRNTSGNLINLTQAAAVDQIKADLVVTNVAVSQCAANPTSSKARLVVTMTSFNDGASTGSTDRTGDYIALVQAFRRSDSADPAGTLKVEAQVSRCLNASCSDEEQIVNPVDLGISLTVGSPFTLKLIWDAPNNRFLAGVSSIANVPLPYAASDSNPAIRPAASIQVSNSSANCTAGPTEADLTAAVRRVRTNVSAVVP